MISRVRNRRWSKRKTYIAGISVYLDDTSIKECRTRNISLEGMLVKPAIEDVHKGSFLRVTLPFQAARGVARYNIPVKVIHTSERGMGLMFTRYDHELLNLITEMTYGITK